MLNSVFPIIIFLVSYFVSGQAHIKNEDTIRYVTYLTNDFPTHEVQFSKEKICLFVYPRPLYNSITNCFGTTIENDTLSFYQGSNTDGSVKDQGIPLLDQDMIVLNEDFNSNNFAIISENELRLTSANRPYFKKTYVDSLFGENKVFCAAKGQILKIPSEFENYSDIKQLFENPKRVKLRKLDGKQGYEKYGVMGIRGVLEFYERKKCKKNKK